MSFYNLNSEVGTEVIIICLEKLIERQYILMKKQILYIICTFTPLNSFEYSFYIKKTQISSLRANSNPNRQILYTPTKPPTG